MKMHPFVALVACCAALVFGTASAQDSLKLAIGQRGNWENAPAELGQKAGIFRKHGLTLEILYTQGGGETLQAVLSGSVDIGVGVGMAGTMGAFAKGAPVRAIANSTTGADDLFWYVPANSPIKSLKDAAGKTIAYSTTGSSTWATSRPSRATRIDVLYRSPPAARLPRSRRSCPARSTSAGRRRRSRWKRCSRDAFAWSPRKATCRRFATRPCA